MSERLMRLENERFPRIPGTDPSVIESRVWSSDSGTAISISPVLGYRVTIKYLGQYQPASARRTRSRSAEVWLIDFFFLFSRVTRTIPFYRANPDGGLKVINARRPNVGSFVKHKRAGDIHILTCRDT